MLETPDEFRKRSGRVEFGVTLDFRSRGQVIRDRLLKHGQLPQDRLMKDLDDDRDAIP